MGKKLDKNVAIYLKDQERSKNMAKKIEILIKEQAPEADELGSD